MIDATTIAVPAILGAVLTLVIPLVTRNDWPRGVKFAIAIGITLAVAAGVMIAAFAPSTWEVVAAWLAVAVAVGQVVYGALKGTGLFDWISSATEYVPARAEDDSKE